MKTSAYKNEMSPWVFMINSLYYTRDLGKELSLDVEKNPYFWEYSLKVLKEFKKEAPEVNLFFGKPQLEDILENHPVYFSVKDNKLILDPKFGKDTLKNVNKYFSKEISDKFPEIFIKAYAETGVD